MTSCSPRLWFLELRPRRAAGRPDPEASSSMVPSDTISPAIFAKRLARPRIVTKPSASIETISAVSCELLRGLDQAGTLDPQIPEHHVGSSDEQPTGIRRCRPPARAGSSTPGSNRPTVPVLTCSACSRRARERFRCSVALENPDADASDHARRDRVEPLAPASRSARNEVVVIGHRA